MLRRHSSHKSGPKLGSINVEFSKVSMVFKARIIKHLYYKFTHHHVSGKARRSARGNEKQQKKVTTHGSCEALSHGEICGKGIIPILRLARGRLGSEEMSRIFTPSIRVLSRCDSRPGHRSYQVYG
jgi:hypothetical protein